MLTPVSKESIRKLITNDDLLVIDDRFKEFPLTLEKDTVLPEPFLRQLLMNTRYGSKSSKTIEMTIQYFNDTKNEHPITSFPRAKITAIRDNVDYIHLIYPVLIAASGSVFEPRRATPITIALMLMLVGSRSKTDETLQKNELALQSHFLLGEGPTYIAELISKQFETEMAVSNISRLLKTAKEKLKMTEKILEALLVKS